MGLRTNEGSRRSWSKPGAISPPLADANTERNRDRDYTICFRSLAQ
jgi:hypothetical protein